MSIFPNNIFLFENPITENADDRWLSKRSDDSDVEYIRKDIHDYEHRLLSQFFWREYVSHPDEMSWFFEVDDDYGMYKKGNVLPNLNVHSDIHPSSYHQLTWKEANLKLSYNIEYIK